MSKLLDQICKVRDLMISTDYNKFKFHKMNFLKLKEEIHRQVGKKARNYNHELDFTSQDLREMAQDIRDCLNRWSEIMDPEQNIKNILANVKNNQVDLQPFQDNTIPILTARTDVIQPLTELLGMTEYLAVYLYFIEEASEDRLALNCNVRFE